MNAMNDRFLTCHSLGELHELEQIENENDQDNENLMILNKFNRNLIVITSICREMCARIRYRPSGRSTKQNMRHRSGRPLHYFTRH